MSLVKFLCIRDYGSGPVAVFRNNAPSFFEKEMVLNRANLEVRIANLVRQGLDVTEEKLALATMDQP